jgi:signal transduction histidine kinase
MTGGQTLERTPRCDVLAAVRIHDQVVPRLCAVARVLAAGGDVAAGARLRLHDELTAALVELREALLVTSATPDARSLRAAVQAWQAEGVPVELTHADDVRISAEVKRLVLDVVAEAVRNALRHGHPSAIRVRADETGGRLVVSIASNGAARTAARSGLGVGLSLASAAAVRHGGRLDWGPAREGEWLVRLTLPARTSAPACLPGR